VIAIVKVLTINLLRLHMMGLENGLQV